MTQQDPLRLAYIRPFQGGHGYGTISEMLPRALSDAGAINIPSTSFDWDLVIAIEPPTIAAHVGRDRRDLVFHTMVDTSRVPADWVEVINQSGGCWVPSSWCQDVFQASGVKVPIFVSGYGVQYQTYNPRGTDGPLRVLAWGDALYSRKNMLLCIEAFIKAGLKDATLEVKLNLDPIEIPPCYWVDEAGREYKNITITHANWHHTKLYDWIRTGHVGLYLSKGEGYGLQPAEMMSTGLPMITVIHTGLADHISHDCVLLVPSREVPSKFFCESGVYPKESTEFEPDIDAVVEHLRWAYIERQGLSDLGLMGCYSVQRHTWKNAGEQAYTQLRHFANGQTQG